MLTVDAELTLTLSAPVSWTTPLAPVADRARVWLTASMLTASALTETADPAQKFTFAPADRLMLSSLVNTAPCLPCSVTSAALEPKRTEPESLVS